jgi:FkbM family methyltransferase
VIELDNFAQMSRFSSLIEHLPFGEALAVYLAMKTGRWNDFRLKKLKHPFAMRNNPYDFATFEEVLLQETYHIPAGFVPETIIDGGANIGLTAIYFASKFPGASIVSVEPDKENFQFLRENSRPYPNIIPLQAGIWSKETYLQLIDSGKGNNAFTVEESESAGGNVFRALTPGGIMRQRQWKSIDILKLDIEGSEKNVFESNYEDWLPFVNMLIIELHDMLMPGSSATVLEVLSAYGFSGSSKGENWIFINNRLKKEVAGK